MSRGAESGSIAKVKRSHGTTWVLRYTNEDHKQVRKTLRTPDGHYARTRTEAVRAQHLIIFERDNALRNGNRTPWTWEEALDHFLKAWAPTVTRNHASNTRRSIELVMRDCAATTPKDLTRRKILAWTDERAKTHSAATVNLEIAALSVFVNWLMLRDYLEESPLDGVKTKKGEQTRPRRAFEDAELARLFPVLQDEDAWRPHYYPMEWPMYGLWATGCRHGEIRQLEWRDVLVDERVISLRAATVKTREARTVPVSEEFLERAAEAKELQGRRQERVIGPRDPVFLSRQGCALDQKGARLLKHLNRCMDIAGVEKIDAEGETLCIHSFRATYITRALRANVPLVQLMKIVGHKTPTMIMKHYEKLNLDDLKNAADRIPGSFWAPSDQPKTPKIERKAK